MSKENFTKGPWFVAETSKFNHMVCAVSQNHTVYADTAVSKNAGYDAALIAAAPEMYEMLKTACSMFSGTEFAKRAEALLAKARGEQ